jgi:hypothetical protein
MSTAQQTIHFGRGTALISMALAPISNCNCIAKRVVDRTFDFKVRYRQQHNELAPTHTDLLLIFYLRRGSRELIFRVFFAVYIVFSFVYLKSTILSVLLQSHVVSGTK